MCLTRGRISSPHKAFTHTCRIGGVDGGGDGCKLVAGVGEHVAVGNFTGGGVDRVFGYTSVETIIGVAVAGGGVIGGGKADALFTGGVVEVDVGC